MRRKLFKLLVAMMISVTALFALGMTAFAYTAGDFTITATNGGELTEDDYTYSGGVLTIKSSTPVTISGTTTADRIEVKSGVSANITLAGVDIAVSSLDETAAFKIADDSRGNVTITLADGTTNTLKSGTKCAGLQKNGDYSNYLGMLTIQGDTGILNATGGERGAGIGGGHNDEGSNIIINGGTITATGGKYGAGIGGGYNDEGSYITISGGTVTATGGERGAGIGGGYGGDGTDISISGGMVTATGGSDGAGIGGGEEGDGSTITISGGTVIATGGERGAGIGGGNDGDGSDITISGGTVTATGDQYAASIGGGFCGNGSNIKISNSIVAVTGNEYATGIGGGENGNGACDLSGTQNAIIIDNGAKTVTPYGDVNLTEDLEVPENFIMTIPEGTTLTVSADVTLTNNGIINNNGAIVNNGTINNSNIIINDGEISGEEIEGNEITVFDLIVTGGDRGTDYTVKNCILTVLNDKPITVKNADPNKATISRIVVENGVSANITLAGVNIDVSLLDETAALMIADNSTGNVTITLADDTTNTLKSGLNCAGLQKNGNADGIGKLIINGDTGILNVTGGRNGAGIGGGIGDLGSNITINGGTITATGGEMSAGIGGGCEGAGSNITISGGTVTATGGEQGAGIGGGDYGDGTDITISGGTVNATGGEQGAGIGGGGHSYGTDITISGGTVNATGGERGAGIGGGNWGAGSNITISGGSVKAVAGLDANDIGGGDGKAAVTPTNGTEEVYLLTIANPNSETVTIDKEEYTPTNHTAADSLDTNLYVYLTGTAVHTVKVGTVTTNYYFDNSFAAIGSDLVITADNGADLVYGTDYTYPASTGVLTIRSEKAVTIKNTDPSTPTTNRIEVAKDISANITLAGVNINVSSLDDTAAFKIADDSTGNVTITLADGTTNTLKSGKNCAGLQKNGNADGIGKLIINGDTGILNVIGGRNGAGIGGGIGDLGSNITINGGTITATGGEMSAGIGGGGGGNDVIGYNGTGSNITISGGTVNASGGNYAAGIGGGFVGAGSNITISGGTVNASGDDYGAGIGGGGGGTSSDIIISGGSVNASSIGCTPTNGTDDVYLLTIPNPSGAPITIDGTEYTPTNHTAADPADTNLYVYLTGEAHTVEFGESTINYAFDSTSSSFVAVGTDLVITADDGTDLVYGTDYTYPASTGVLTIRSEKAVTISGTTTTDRIEVAKDISANITLAGVNIDISTQYREAAFMIADNSTGNVTITLADGTTNTLKSGTDCAGLQKNGSADGIGTLTIQGGTAGTGVLNATGGENGAGIGSVFEMACSNIIISGGNVTATGGDEAAGIGGGFKCAASKITISGGTVTAIGGINGAGIGGGAYRDGSDIIISGGSVKAVAGTDANAIGGGADKDAVTPTDGNGNNVYLLEIENTENADIAINGTDYPDKHFDEAKIYAYLPAKTADEPNVVTVGDETIEYCYDTTNAKWLRAVEAPTFTPASGTTFTSSQKVTISCATEGAKIYYTTDGTAPTTASTLYEGEFTITATTTVKAIAVKEGMTDSSVATATYTKKSSGGGGGGGGYIPSRPSTPSNPEIGGESASWTKIADDISKLPIGSEVTIKLNGNYDVPVDVIKAIADRDVKVTFIVDSTRSWYVDGAKIETPAAADFSILTIASLNADALRGDVGTKFRVDGTNIPTELKLAFAKKNAGKFANLYKKDGDKLVFVDNIKVDENGKVILPVSEQGDYVIMLCEFSDRKGDVSNDGITSAKDASSILKDIVELEAAANPVMLDYNGDGRVSALDASSILKDIVNGVI